MAKTSRGTIQGEGNYYMKSAEEWIEEHPILVTENVNLPLGHPDIQPNKKRAVESYLSFVRQIQIDALKEAAEIACPSYLDLTEKTLYPYFDVKKLIYKLIKKIG